MGNLCFCTQLWETLKKINTISWAPDNPLCRSEVETGYHKNDKIHESRVHTGVPSKKRTAAANCFQSSFRVWVFFFPYKNTLHAPLLWRTQSFYSCYSTPTPTSDISQVRRGSPTHRRRMRLMSYLLIQNVSAKKILHPERLTRKGREGGREGSWGRKYLLPRTFPEFLTSPYLPPFLPPISSRKAQNPSPDPPWSQSSEVTRESALDSAFNIPGRQS